ncbi:type II secretion system F family protein [Methanosarcina barkeri]|uniref:type II secretion system F family protein n=1 Tax=Methanosarcina barkeri TaxID=2208 RepID=UPI001FB3DDDC|nr:type II secretion system F family protein [Methanosarcina barkeri]
MLANSLKIIADSKMGILSKELKKLKEDLSWGTSTSKALMNLENSIKTPSSSRILHILVKANESTSDLKNVLSITAKQARNDEDMKKERSSAMIVYVITIYVAFFVFLFIVYILATNFFPQTASFSTSSQGMGGVSGYFNVEEYSMLMFHSAWYRLSLPGLLPGRWGRARRIWA